MKKLIVCVLALFFMGSLFAQNPTKWNFKVVQNEKEGTATLIFDAKIDKGWHLYSQYTDPNGALPMTYEFEKSGNYERVGKVVEATKYTEEMDDVFHVKIRHFSNNATFKQTIKILSKEDFVVKGVVSYQTCDEGRCIPSDVPFQFKVKGFKGEIIPSPAAAIDTAKSTSDSEKQSTSVNAAPHKIDTAKVKSADSNSHTQKKESKSLWIIFFLSLGAGLLALVTPCVFPMIPMTISFFMKGNKTHRQGMQQAIFFGLSIIFIFGGLGLLLTLLLGKDAMYVISTHWIPNLIFFGIFMVFALSFFGLFELTLPSSWINKSDEQAGKGGYFGTFFVAFTTVLVSFSCTGPILGAALIGLSSGSGSSMVFLISMIGFSLGFALPFTLFAMFPSVMQKMKSGSWLNTIKIVFGFLEIALGLKFLSMADLGAGWGILDRETFLCLWIVVFTMLGFYLLGKLKFKGDADLNKIPVGRLMLAIVTFSFVVYMIPGLWGAPLKALSGYVPPITTQDFDLNRIIYENRGGGGVAAEKDGLPADRKYTDKLHLPTGFEGFFDLNEAKAYAKKVNKPIFVDFTGKTCANCREMENNVWNAPHIKKLLNEKFVMVALYADVNYITLPEKEWKTSKDGVILKTLGQINRQYQIDRFNFTAQPYYVIMDANENVLTKENKAYDKNVSHFEQFLLEGLENFAKGKK